MARTAKTKWQKTGVSRRNGRETIPMFLSLQERICAEHKGPEQRPETSWLRKFWTENGAENRSGRGSLSASEDFQSGSSLVGTSEPGRISVTEQESVVREVSFAFLS